MGVVGKERKVAAQLDDAGQFAAIVISPADRFSGGFVNGEHARQLIDALGNGHRLSREPVYA